VKTDGQTNTRTHSVGVKGGGACEETWYQQSTVTVCLFRCDFNGLEASSAALRARAPVYCVGGKSRITTLPVY
jgi:superfamily II RNA helicase